MNTSSKIITSEELKEIRRRLRADGKIVAFTNGCFDILHSGHVSYLEAIKRPNHVLIVGVNSDRSVREIKGPSRPIMQEQERALLVAALACVDHVVIFDEPTPQILIQALMPDILAKGEDWKGKDVIGRETVEGSGGKVEFISFVEGRSTTNVIERIMEKCQKT